MNNPLLLKNPYITEKDCRHFESCSPLGIVTDWCKAGAHNSKRCTQGDLAQIKLLASIKENLRPK